jgi:predicted AlkP superfamily pyrophosphatase or phosphodiesterase
VSAADDAGRVIVLDVVGMQPDQLDHASALRGLVGPATGESVTELGPPFPAVTVPAQTTLATGQSPATHGDVSSGEYDRERDEVTFWGRDRGGRDRLWETASDAGLTTGALFFQHLIGSSADVAMTPSPVEDENNDLIEMDCWSNPNDFYDELETEYGHFPLHRYWGPGAGAEASEWILRAASEAVRRYDPDLLWVYVPHLDYDAQRRGPDADEVREAVETVDGIVGDFLDDLRGDDRWGGTAVALVSEYGFHAVDQPVFPNRALAERGYLVADETGDLDLESSDAFAMVDHQVAHVYADEAVRGDVADVLSTLDGVDAVLGEDGKREAEIDHPNAGDLVLRAGSNAWFQYYWWHDDGERPPYATEVEIHEKPGFDPCELFFGDEGMVSLDPSQVGGSHGRVEPETRPVFALGGPAAPSLSLDGPVDARTVAPTVADLLNVSEAVDADPGVASLLDSE